MDLSPDEDQFQGRLLHQAALWDNLELLQELLSSGADVESRDQYSRRALHAAALAEGSRCLRALAQAGADVNAVADAEPPAFGKTALHVAAERGHIENVRTLLRAGCDVSVADAGGDTALALAARGRHVAVAQLLQQHADAVERERLAQHTELRELVSRADVTQLKSKLAELGRDAELIVNMTPGGANTLLYAATEAGVGAVVACLLQAGADGRAHPVTRYCPLYMAAYHGHLDIARQLLAHFPEAVQQETVEKWLPLHAACIGGHAAMVTLLLTYHYPERVLQTYTDPSGRWQYKFAFDVNARDVSGQSALYVASTLGNLAVLDALLAHTVPARPARADQSPPIETSPAHSHRAVLREQRGISLGIHAIVSKLTAAVNASAEPVPSTRSIRPISLDLGRGPDSCVAVAVRNNHSRVLKKLLAAGARANASAAPPQQSRSSNESRRTDPSPSRGQYEDDGAAGWSALWLAASLRRSAMVEELLAAGAADPGDRALRECARHGLLDLVAKLLAAKAYPDPEYKINKPAVTARVFRARAGGEHALTYSGLCPDRPVAIDWRELKAKLAYVRVSWLRAACAAVNTRLGSASTALLALTRLDVANNDLRALPPELFTMLSLRYLNAAQNKLERLPTASDPLEEETEGKRRGRKSKTEMYSAPVLQELYLQDNRLEWLPEELFSLPALATLDVSNNKLRALPAALWAAPALRDLSAALNHLRDLPADRPNSRECGSPALLSSPEGRDHSVSSIHDTSSHSKASSRSPSVERSESEGASEAESGDETEEPVVLGDRSGNAVASAARLVHEWRGAVEAEPAVPQGGCPLHSLNLSHNQFTCVPAALACRAPSLQRLNMSYNSLRSMSYVTSYPTSLRQLDLSHNEITCWPSLPQVENFGASDDPLSCYCALPGGGGGAPSRSRPRSGSVRAQLLTAACPAKRHLRLEGLRTLILANNLLTRIQLTTDDDGYVSSAPEAAADEDEEWGSSNCRAGRLLFPLLSMLDVSSNMLRSIPPHIHELTNLSVLNVSGNKDITDLPPQMGLLSRLWNLNTTGCSLQEPLRSMVASGRYKSMDIVGYLKSVLQEARPYTRMKLMLVGLQGIGKTSLLECLRQESSIQHRRKPTEHWAKRMGNKSSRRGGGNVSTVGVDIGTWLYEKHRSSRGPVTFRTWDFGGQHQYYSTHQYFLSRRSLYLVVWKVTDGRKGLAGALDWLRSIQARAPGSPVIMVATHYDQVANSSLPESESPEALQRVIRGSIIAAPDADKLGLPRVLDSIEVSCSTRHNIRILADIIYTIAFSVKSPGSKEPLLEQRVPATYIALEEAVTAIAAELKEPVLRHEEYKKLVTQYMQQKNLRMFRDSAELHQATMFLHENGVVLHYDDATLKELYFLKPQWLCDVLAHVVTVREINPFASNGIMKVEDLAHVFKASPALSRGEEAGALGLSLLNKFELALCWEPRTLLVPPLLPDHPPPVPQLPLRSRMFGSRRPWAGAPLAHSYSQGTDSPVLIQESNSSVVVSGRSGRYPLRRVLLLSYLPRGFWARLTTRLLADDALADAAHNLYRVPSEMDLDESTAKALELNWGWRVWSRGLQLVSGAIVLCELTQLSAARDLLLGPVGLEPAPDTTQTRYKVRQEGVWCSLDPGSSASVEWVLPAQVCVARRRDGLPIAGYQSISLEPNPETLAKVLAILSDHVDLLLEDWYPSLGTRFVHTSEGRCLITRLVPCCECLKEPPPPVPGDQDLRPGDLGLRPGDLDGPGVEAGMEPAVRLRVSEESRISDGDSGVGPDSNASSRLGSVEGVCLEGAARGACPRSASTVHAWTVEECVLAACTGQPLPPHAQAHVHGDVTLADVAPDTLLLDVGECSRVRWEQLTCVSVVGRGAWGTVLAARWGRGGSGGSVTGAESVAVKTLQPVPPPRPDPQAEHAYRAGVARWQAAGGACAVRAYCALRQELAVLSALAHPHVLRLRAVCAAPLALVLELAPQGGLDGVLRSYRGGGARVGRRAGRAVALQVARALEYLHARRVVYRDLKSENVLVWSMPRPQDALQAERSPDPIEVYVKLGDYGISRLAPPSGTKGFGGTEGFMAPEIMRYNGEEEYNEKVDCFSFGMLLYELLTLRQPFEGHEAVKEAVLDGARPPLSPAEVSSPCCVVECMRRCWSGSPALRPSAAALVSVTAAPEYTALCAAAPAPSPAPAGPAAAVPHAHSTLPDEEYGWEVWWGGSEAERVHALRTLRATPTTLHTLRLPPDKSEPVFVSAMCRVGSHMWVGDSAGRVNVYSISTMSLSWSVGVSECVGGSAGSRGVAALAHLPSADRVALALHSGRLFLTSTRRPQAEGSFVLTELGAASSLRCLTHTLTSDGCTWLCAGGDALYVYSLRGGSGSGGNFGGGGVCAAEVVPAAPHSSVALLAAPRGGSTVIGYCEPGVCLYQWSLVTKQQTGRLDCSKLVPCSESLQSIAIDEHLDADKCRVTALCCLGGAVYAGTAWGCVVVAHAETLTPLTVFRPYEEEVVAIVPLACVRGTDSGACVATLGAGYRPLLQRFAPPQANSQTTYPGSYCLIWRADHWLPD